MLPHLITLLAVLGFHVAFAFHNVSIDDSDASVVYSGSWNAVLPNSGMAANGTYKVAMDDSQAYATVKFTGEVSFVFCIVFRATYHAFCVGVAIYYLSQKWPFHVTTNITLDGGRAVLLDLQEYREISTIPEEDYGQAMVIASATGLENREHTVRVSVGIGEQYAVINKLMYVSCFSGVSL